MARISVLIDGVVFENNHQIGIWRVFYEVMRRTSGEIQYTLLLAKKPKQAVPEDVAVATAWHRAGSRHGSLLTRAANAVGKRYVGGKYGNAIWHSTYFTLDPSRDRRSVVTVHDMIAEKCFHIGGSWCAHDRTTKASAVSRADEILAVSHATTSDLEKFHPQLRQRVSVVSLGFEHIAQGREAQFCPDSSPYALFVGSRCSYKNFGTVLEALASADWPTGVRLRVVGPPFSEMELSLLAYYSVAAKVQRVGRVSDAELSVLYRNAQCLVFPSLAEGFGIPILEAQANGCVPVVSDIAVFREVAGQGAIYFNPRDPRTLCEAVRRSRENNLRLAVIHAAQTNIRRFSWDTAAELVLDSYRRVSKL